MNTECANTYYLNKYLDELDRTDGLTEMLNAQVLDVVEGYMNDGWDFSSTGKHTAPREISWEAMAEMDAPKACDALTEAVKAEIDGDISARTTALNEFALAALQGAMDYLRGQAQTDVEEKKGVEFDLDEYDVDAPATSKGFKVTLISGLEVQIQVKRKAESYAIYQVMPCGAIKEIHPNSIDLAKIIAEFEEA